MSGCKGFFWTISALKRRSPLLFLFILPASGWSQDLAWIRQMGGTNYDYGLAVAIDYDGNAYIAGQFEKSARLGDIILHSTNTPAPYLAKVTPQGAVVWANSFGDTWATRIGGVAIDPAGFVYEAGSFVGAANFGTNRLVVAGDGSMDDVFLAKYDLNGTLIWAKRYGGSDIDRCGGLFVDDSGNVFLSGSYRRFGVLGNISLPGTGLQHAWVAKLNGQGEVQWASSASSEIWLYSEPKVTADAQGNVYVAGGFMRSLNFPIGTNIVASTNMAENMHLPGLAGDGMTMFLAKYDSAGQCLWARSGGGPAVDLVADDGGHIYVTGVLRQNFGQPYSGMFDNILVSGNNDCFLAKFDAAAGAVLWAINEGGTSMAMAPNGDICASENLYMNRTFSNQTFSAIGYVDIFVGRYDQMGNPVAAWQIGDLEADQAGGIGVDRFGSIWLVGSSFHSSNLSNYGLTNYGLWDVVVAKLEQAGPAIVKQPQKVTLYQGSNAVFTVQVTNAVSPRFQWYKNGTSLPDDARISGATNETLIIWAAGTSDEADYNVRITADNGQVISSTVQLRIEGLVRFVKAEKGPLGSFLLTFTGTTGHLYDVEVSTNCVDWRFLTNGFCREDTLTIGDFSGAGSQQRFYRAVTH